MPQTIIGSEKEWFIFRLDEATLRSLRDVIRRMEQHFAQSLRDKFLLQAATLPIALKYCSMSGSYCDTGKLHDARATIHVASQTLTWDDPPPNTEENRKLRTQLRNDIWGISKNTDRVDEALEAFRGGIIRLCRSVVDHEFKRGVK